MLTPRFNADQDDAFVLLTIRCPYIKTQEIDFLIDGSTFRLDFKHELVENGTESASYDISTGELMIKLPKLNHGEHFADLNLLTKLIVKNNKNLPTSSLITDLSAEESPPLIVEASVGNGGYGFASQYTDIFRGFEEMTTIHDFFELGNPEEWLKITDAEERKDMRRKMEDLKFDDEYYLHNLMESEQVESIVAFQPFWHKASRSNDLKDIADALSTLSISRSVIYTDTEKERMTRLPLKQYAISVEESQSLLINIASILMAFAYEYRLNDGELGTESPWTISMLTPVFSWLERYDSLYSVVENFIRRSLCFPLYRHWELSITCVNDAANILNAGKSAVLKVMLLLIDAFEHHEDAWRFSRIYLEDCACWIQQLSEDQLQEMYKTSDEIVSLVSNMTKESIEVNGISLESIESLLDVEEETSTDESGSDSEESSDDIDSIDDLSSSHSSEPEATHSEIKKKPLIEML